MTKLVKYAGIGSRETPMPVLIQMEMLGALFGARGFLLRSGKAKGADTAFEVGCDKVRGNKLIRVATIWKPALEHAARYHPNWEACDRHAQALHARNSLVMLGDRFDDPVDFVCCWTPGGRIEGGTGQALRIAADPFYAIPVFNLAIDGAHDAMWQWIAERGL